MKVLVSGASTTRVENSLSTQCSCLLGIIRDVSEAISYFWGGTSGTGQTGEMAVPEVHLSVSSDYGCTHQHRRKLQAPMQRDAPHHEDETCHSCPMLQVNLTSQAPEDMCSQDSCVFSKEKHRDHPQTTCVQQCPPQKLGKSLTWHFQSE